MSKFLSVTLLLLLVFGISINSYSSPYFPPTASQKHFTAILNGLPSVVNASWDTPVSLWVKVSSKAVGSPPNQNKADALAKILADRGRTALFQPFCVHIYQKKNQVLGSKCVY